MFLITRPQGQAENLQALIHAAGGKTLLLPTITIEFLSIDDATWQTIKNNDYAIFVSANAVPALHGKKFPSKIIAIGPGTARALQDANFHVDFLPENFNSESILQLPILQNCKGKKISLFCGENSKPLLKNTLTARGGLISECVCYRRLLPNTEAKIITDIQTKPISTIIATSLESLRNLHTLFNNSEWHLSKNLVVINAPMLAFAKSIGWQAPILLSANASDQAIFECLHREGVKFR